jgi:hypothetical protein
MSSASYRRLYSIAAAVLLAMVAGWLLHDLWLGWRTTLHFDDAYMFARYAMNMRHGLGISWNLDGAHTYGQTSLLWCGVVMVLSYLPLDVWKMLSLGSWLSGIGALIAMAWAVAANAKSDLLRSTWRVLPWVALPLTATAVFTGNQGTGMETMLAALLAAVFVGMALGWSRGKVRPEWVALVGFALFMTRPDAAIVIVMLPALLFVLMPWSGERVGKGSVARLLGLFVAGVVVELVVCKLYFHTALPLSFYMKSRHAYEGYRSVWHPELLMLAFFAACELYLVAMILLGRREDWRLIACSVTPALVTFAYLGTVTQIMGFEARYYVPYFAFFVVPALLVVDRWMAGGESSVASDDVQWPGKTLLVRGMVTAVVMVGFLALSSEGVLAKIRHVEARTHVEYDPARVEMAAKVPLPTLPWSVVMTDLTDLLVAPLPKGATVAATEVGYLGDRAAQVNMIDLAGLNDNEIALHGFDVHALLLRKPDVIWMPNTDYTYQNAWMMSDPELLKEYDVYAGAANYGLAIRKDSPYRVEIDQQMQVFWDAAYPGYRMSDYLVRSAGWTRAKHRVVEQ